MMGGVSYYAERGIVSILSYEQMSAGRHSKTQSA